jgi:hypothetical protein
VLAPLATLILMQMMFLPYHSFRITWWHRIIVAADVILVIEMWSLFFKYSGTTTPLLPFRARSKLRLAARGVTCLAVVAFAFWLSVWEGRWAGEPFIGRADVVGRLGLNFGATESGVVFGLFPDRLEVAREPIVGKEKHDKTQEEMASREGSIVPTIKFDHRDLQGANLSGADLRGVSLSWADMRGAVLVGADLDGAHLDSARIQSARLWSARLRGADLQGAQLQGADFLNAQLGGASLRNARMQGTWLNGAQLQGTDLGSAEMEGAYLAHVQMQGANLSLCGRILV